MKMLFYWCIIKSWFVWKKTKKTCFMFNYFTIIGRKNWFLWVILSKAKIGSKGSYNHFEVTKFYHYWLREFSRLICLQVSPRNSFKVNQNLKICIFLFSKCTYTTPKFNIYSMWDFLSHDTLGQEKAHVNCEFVNSCVKFEIVN